MFFFIWTIKCGAWYPVSIRCTISRLRTQRQQRRLVQRIRLRLPPVPLRLRHPPRLILRLTCGCTEKDDDTNRDADKGGGTGIIKKKTGSG